LTLFGTFGCSTSEDPCDGARFGCSDSAAAFDLDKDCDLVGGLAVEIGQGESEYSGIAVGEFPQTFTGTQGGQHVFLGLRLTNAALDRYDKLLASFRFHVVAGCSSSTHGVPIAVTDLGEPGSCLFQMAARRVVLGEPHPIQTDAVGAVEEFGVLLQIPHVPDRIRVIDVEVTDPCGRTGGARHVAKPL